MSLSIPLLLDVAIAILLAVTIVYAVILNRKLGALRDTKGELQRQIIEFQGATDRAEGTLKTLRSTAQEAGGPLQAQIDQGERLFGELKFLIDRAGSIADRLEQAAAKDPRPAQRTGERPPARTDRRDPEPPPGAGAVSPEQADLIKALQGVR